MIVGSVGYDINGAALLYYGGPGGLAATPGWQGDLGVPVTADRHRRGRICDDGTMKRNEPSGGGVDELPDERAWNKGSVVVGERGLIGRLVMDCGDRPHAGRSADEKGIDADIDRCRQERR